MQKGLQSNIWKITVYLTTNKRIFIALLGAYYLSIPGVTAESIGIILLLSSVAGFLMEIPSGYFSDKIGHKKALVLSRVLMAFSSAFFLFAQNIYLLILGAVFFSFATSFLTGTLAAFMHETLRGLGKEKDYTKIMGKIRSISMILPIALAVSVPFLIETSFKLPFAIALAIDLIGLIVAISLVVPKTTKSEIQEIATTNFKQVLTEGLRLGFFKYALFSSIIGGFLFGVVSFGAPYQVFLGIPIMYFGIFFGIGRMMSALLLAYSGKIKECFSINSFLLFRMIVFAVLILYLGLFENPEFIILAFIGIEAARWGLSEVTNGFHLEIIRDSKFKATLLSVGPQMTQIISAMIGFSMGWSIERISYQSTYLYVGIIFVALLAPLYLYIVRRSR